MNTTTEEEEIESKDSQGGGRYHRHLIRTAENICLGITANSDFERKTLLDATRERCCCDSLPSELLARIFALVTESAWKNCLQATPSVMEMSSFAGRGLNASDGHGAVEDQQIDGSFSHSEPSLCEYYT